VFGQAIAEVESNDDEIESDSDSVFNSNHGSAHKSK
jgi:hypothetical protein